MNPAPFIVACPSGHMDDFPWREFVHRGHTNCKAPMQLKSMGKTGTVRDLWVYCTCGDKRTVGEAFGAKKHEVAGACSRKRPWLGPDNIESKCQHADEVETLQRGATKVYAVDTGYGTLAWKLRKDDRVVVMERTNAMHVELPELLRGLFKLDR